MANPNPVLRFPGSGLCRSDKSALLALEYRSVLSLRLCYEQIERPQAHEQDKQGLSDLLKPQ